MCVCVFIFATILCLLRMFRKPCITSSSLQAVADATLVTMVTTVRPSAPRADTAVAAGVHAVVLATRQPVTLSRVSAIVRLDSPGCLVSQVSPLCLLH